jgi:hypothetical protein
VSLLGGFLVAGLLLTAAGAMKVHAPRDSARALSQLVPAIPLATSVVVVRVAAGLEGLLGLTALIVPFGAVAVAVGVSYAAFAVFVLVARARGGVLSTCGCFGQPDTPPTVLHAVLDLGLAASALAVAFAPHPWPTPAQALVHQPALGIPLALLSLLGAWVVYLVMVRFARLQVVRRQLVADAGWQR